MPKLSTVAGALGVVYFSVALYPSAKDGLHTITKDLGVEQAWLDVPDDHEFPNPVPSSLMLLASFGLMVFQPNVAQGKRRRPPQNPQQNPQPKHRKP